MSKYQDLNEFRKDMLEYYVNEFEDFKKRAQKSFPNLDFSHFKLGDDTISVIDGDKGECEGNEVNSMSLIEVRE